MAGAVQMVAVHYANRNGRGRAAFFVAIDTARELIEARMAVWSKGCRYLNLLKTEAELYKPDLSLRIGPGVMEGFTDGVPKYVEIVNRWAPVMIGREMVC